MTNYIRSYILAFAVCGACLAVGCEKQRSGWKRLAEEVAPPEASADHRLPPREDEPRAEVRITSDSITAVGVLFGIPPGWETVEPMSRMRLAQFRIPGPAGGAEAAIFYFGDRGGGPVQMNIERWLAQFSADNATTATQEPDTSVINSSDGLTVTLVRASGTYTPSSMMGGEAEPIANQALFGLMIEGGPQGTLFVKITGPQQTMEERRDELENFARNIRRGR